LSEALRLAKATKRPICAAFMDLENAYGSMKHNHVQFALLWYHFPAPLRQSIFNYYERQFARVFTDDFASDWSKWEAAYTRVVQHLLRFSMLGSISFWTLLFNLTADYRYLPM
jgi:hypothetical protein